MTIDRLEWHLENWRAWMKNSTNKLYYSKSTLFKNGTDSTVDVFEMLCEESDKWAAKTLDALIDDLPCNQTAAVHHKWLFSVYKMRDFEMAYEQAINTLLNVSPKKGLI